MKDTGNPHLSAVSGTSGIFYGWKILATGCVAECLAYGVRNSFSVFYVAILNHFGWSRGDTALIFSAGIVAYGLTAPVSGALLDRFGPRRILPVGAGILATGAAACSMATEIWQFAFCYCLVSIGTCLTAFVPYAALTSRWFVARRGQAFGILNAGWGTSFVFILGAQLLINAFGWQATYLILAVAVAAILIPLETIVPRSRPSDVGSFPDGQPPIEHRAPGPVPRESQGLQTGSRWASIDWNLKRALSTYRFWALFAANLCLWGIGQNLLIAHQVAYAADPKFEIGTTVAASVGTVFGIMSSVGAMFGGLSDRMGRERAFSLGCGIALVGVAMLIAVRWIPSAWLLYVYAIVVGLGFGFAGPGLTSSVADLFAGRHFGSINGAMVMGFGLGGAIGPWLGGFIFDTTGDYLVAFICVVAAIVIAVGMLWVAGPRQVRSIV